MAHERGRVQPHVSPHEAVEGCPAANGVVSALSYAGADAAVN